MDWFDNYKGYANYNQDLAELARLREQNPLSQEQMDTGEYVRPGEGGLMSTMPMERNLPLAQFPDAQKNARRHLGRSGGSQAQAPALQSTGLAGLMSMAQAPQQDDPFTQMPQGRLLDYLSLLSTR